MGKRDLVSEIRDRRSRALKGTGRYALFSQRWDSLYRSHELIVGHNIGDLTARRELLRHIPVGLVACIEAYARFAAADLIDHGPPFQENARSLQDVKIDLGTVIDLGREKITIGEFVSHLLPISSLEDIARHFSVLIGKDFLAELKRLPRGPDGEPVETVADSLIPDLRQLFRTRHIICHEMGRKVNLSLARTDELLGAALVFVDAFESLVRECLHQRELRR